MVAKRSNIIMKDKPEYVYQVLLVTKLRNKAYSSEEVALTLDLGVARKKLKEAWEDKEKCYARQIDLCGYEKCVNESEDKCEVVFKNLNEGYFEEDYIKRYSSLRCLYNKKSWFPQLFLLLNCCRVNVVDNFFGSYFG